MKRKYVYKLILFISIITFSVSGNYLYKANQIFYSNKTSNVKTIDESLNELYEKNNLGNASADNITKGKTALVQGKLVTGNGIDNDSFYNNGKLQGKQVVYLGGVGTYDLTKYEGWEKFTTNNLIVGITSTGARVSIDTPMYWTLSIVANKSYSNGKATISVSYNNHPNSNGLTCTGYNAFAYLIY